MATSPKGQADQAIAKIYSALTTAEGKWAINPLLNPFGLGASVGSFLGAPGDSVRAQLREYRTALVPNLVRLAGEIPPTDAARWATWSKTATSILASLERDAQLADSDTVFAIVADIPAATAKTAKKAAVKAAEVVVETAKVASYGLAGLAVLILVGLGAYVWVQAGRR